VTGKRTFPAGTTYASLVDNTRRQSEESWMDQSLLQYRPEIEVFESPLTDRQERWAAAEEMQLAAELLDHVDEGELEDHLVALIDRAGGTVDRPVRSALATVLARAARRMVPRTGAAPSASAGRMLGLEARSAERRRPGV
jgi:hypothetical protein